MDDFRGALEDTPQGKGERVVDRFGERELVRTAETAGSAAAAHAAATVQARFVMALQRPRVMLDVRTRLLKECERSTFAAAARFSIPRGKDRDGNKKYITGWTIRFAEAVIRELGNVMTECQTTFEDEDTRIVKVIVTDLERNNGYSLDVTIAKTVEKRRPTEDDQVVSWRTNSEGKQVAIVVATDEEVLQKQNSLISRAIRTLGLRHVPADILDEASAKCIHVAKAEVKADPGADLKHLLDAFAGLGVMPSDLIEFLGHDVTQMTEEERLHLRGVGAAIRDGDVTWRDALAWRREERGEVEPQAARSGGEVDRKQATLDQVAAKAAKDRAESKAKREAERKAKAAAQQPKEGAATAAPANGKAAPKTNGSAAPASTVLTEETFASLKQRLTGLDPDSVDRYLSAAQISAEVSLEELSEEQGTRLLAIIDAAKAAGSAPAKPEPAGGTLDGLDERAEVRYVALARMNDSKKFNEIVKALGLPSSPASQWTSPQRKGLISSYYGDRLPALT